LTADQYQTWLKLAYARIEGGLPLVFFDCREVGNHELYCNWGMCNDDLAAWPWKDTWYNPEHTVPKDTWHNSECTVLTGPPDRLQVRHVSRDRDHLCPFDSPDKGYAGYGCFYRCRIFSRSAAAARPTHQDALKLIRALQTKVGEQEDLDE